MERKDILVVVISIAAFAVMALVVKPILVGQSPGLPVGGQNPEGTIAPAYTLAQTTVVPATPLPVNSPTPATTTMPIPTPTVAWDGSVKTVGFVNQPGNRAAAYTEPDDTFGFPS